MNDMDEVAARQECRAAMRVASIRVQLLETRENPFSRVTFNALTQETR